MPTDQLVCGLEHASPLAYVSVCGRLDPQTVPALRHTVLKALTAEPEAVLIDLAGVTGLEPIVLTVFLSLARAAAAWPGTQLIQHSAAPALERELAALAIGRHVPLVADRAAAETLAGRHSGPVQVSWDIGGVDALDECREVVRTFCRRHGLAAASDSAELVITELAVNALLHGSAPITARASVLRHFLHLSVRDQSPAMPRLLSLGASTDGGGRGLILVEALTVAWGATAAPTGKIVWCTIRP